VSAYVESGYVEPGYIEGDDILGDISGKVKLKFFINKTENEIGYSDVDGLEDDEVGLFYSPLLRSFSLGTKNGLSKFIGQDEALIQRVSALEDALANIDLHLNANVQMVAADGTILATPQVVKNGTTLTFTIPQELSGAEYSVSMNVSVCEDCEGA